MHTHQSASVKETEYIAREWLLRIAATTFNNEATLVGLSGHLGAGKTAFVKAIATTFGVIEEVTSPTFVIMKIYEIPPIDGMKQRSYPWTRLIHIDAYRLEKREELEVLEWERLVADPHNLIVVEWPENVGLLSSEMKYHLRFELRDGMCIISE